MAAARAARTGLVEGGIGRDGGSVADRRDRIGGARTTIAVDHQPRIGLVDERRVKPAGELGAQRGDADVPRDVPLPLGLVEPEVGHSARNAVSGMIAKQQERGGRPGVQHIHGWRLIGGQDRNAR